MKWVDLVEFDPVERKGNTVVRAILKDGAVSLEGDQNIISRLETKGVSSWSQKKSFLPKDGEQFLKALGETFNDPYLFATELREGDEPKPYEMPPPKDAPKKEPSEKK